MINKLNDLDPKTWLKFQKSWFIHNPPPRKKDVLVHPAKFPEEIQRLLSVDPPLPPSLAGLDAKPEHYEKGPNDYGWFRDFITRKFPRG